MFVSTTTFCCPGSNGCQTTLHNLLDPSDAQDVPRAIKLLLFIVEGTQTLHLFGYMRWFLATTTDLTGTVWSQLRQSGRSQKEYDEVATQTTVHSSPEYETHLRDPVNSITFLLLFNVLSRTNLGPEES
ncbi:hypothetical protein B0H11DRAFT_1924002 [Mycena galericulata]|nr:hypothetical protein B0H11DRAFT_1924002 [Mycena galericulata]